MHRVIQSNLPIEYPITPREREMAKKQRLIEEYAYRQLPDDLETGPWAFNALPTNVDAVARRTREIQALRRRGYSPADRQFSDEELAKGAGLNPNRFTSHEWLNRRDGQYSKGVPHAYHLGNIEGPHGNLLIEMIQRGAEREVSRVLNIGCGQLGFQHRNIENAGVNDIVYADHSRSILEPVRAHLNLYGRPEVQRSFEALDKNDTAIIRSTFKAGSIGTLIRTGVGEMTPHELAGIQHIMAPAGELFVANAVDRQPIAAFLDLIEPAFEDIEVHVGHARYALICGKPRF